MNIVKTYFAHLLLYVGGAYSILEKVGAISPTLIPPAVSVWIPVVGAVLAAVHHSTGAPAGTPPGPMITSVAKLHFLTVLAAGFILGCLVLTGVIGCASLSAKVTAPASQPYVVAAANGAVLIAESQGITAAQINSVAKQALAADSGTAASLSAVSAVVSAQLAKLNLSPAEALVAVALQTGLAQAIQTQIGANATVAAAQAAIADVLGAVIAATNPPTSALMWRKRMFV